MIILMIIAVETLGPTNESASSFLYDFGRRISLVNGEDREPQFFFSPFQSPSNALTRYFCMTVFVVRPPGLVSAPHFNFLQ